MTKKLKITKIICFLVVVSVKYSCCQSDFFVVNKYKGPKFYCITNNSYAISWILEDTASTLNLNLESKFLPSNQLFWKGDCEEVKKHGWKCSESIAEEIITDRRWEKMEVVKADYVEDSEDIFSNLIFKNLAEISTVDFNIPISIRTSREAHLFLCGGVTVNSSCYWLILQGFQGMKSVIRKCPAETVPPKNNVLPEYPCNITKSSVTHSTNASKFLTNEKWNHFTLSKSQNKIALTKQNGKELISYTDKDNDVYEIKNIIVHSKNTVGLWKIHKVKYFKSTQAKRTEFKDPIDPVDGTICFSAFVKMCKLCEIHFEIRNKEDNDEILGHKSYKEMTSWTEITFLRQKIGKKSITFAITTVNQSDRNPYWAISEIKQCGKNEFRVIELNTMANCQLLSPENQIISLDNDITSAAIAQSECMENTISKYCVPCSWFMNSDCGKSKICENINNNLICSCSAGYKPKASQRFCAARCTSNTYGLDCNKNCSDHCINCNYIDGTCARCTDSYIGSKCDMTPVPYFRQKPTVTQNDYTEATILVENFYLKNIPDDTDVTKYKYTIQYKIAASTDRGWTTHEQNNNVNKKQNFIIRTLESGIKYYVRAIIISNETNYELVDDIPKAEFTTKCDAVTNNDLNIEPSNTTARILVVLNNKRKFCPLNDDEFKIEIEPKLDHFGYHFKKMSASLFGLTPFEEFTLLIINKITNIQVQIQFKTTEGVPGKVTDLKTVTTSDSKIQLEWNKPVNIYGKLLYYIVTYQIYNYIACDSQTSYHDQKTNNVKVTSTILSDLNPYTRYLISVKAVNTKFRGHALNILVNTSQSDIINDNEIPQVTLQNIRSRSIQIEFLKVTCSIMRGPLTINIAATCSMEWCKNKTSISLSYNDSTSLTLHSLHPFTTYQLKVTFCRNTCNKDVPHGDFTTKPEAPYTVTDDLVYSKNENSISVRWQPPYPPTGIFKLYQVSSYYENNEPSTDVIENSPCILWPEYQCYTFNNLVAKKEYVIQLRAKNQEPDSFGQLKAIRTITQIDSTISHYELQIIWDNENKCTVVINIETNGTKEPSEAPPDLTIHWTLDNDLDIRWKHPMQANGDIESFRLRVLAPTQNKDKNLYIPYNVTQSEYKPIYQYTIKSTDILSSTPYKIVIRAYNGLGGNESFLTDFTPPEIPLLEADPKIVDVSNNTIKLQLDKTKNYNNQNTYKLFLLVSDINQQPQQLPPELQNFEKYFKKDLSIFRIVYKCNNITTTTEFVIGQIDYAANDCEHEGDNLLTPGTSYNVTVVLVSTFQNKSSYKLYSQDAFTSGDSPDTPVDLSLLALLFLLLIIPIVIVVYIKRRPIGALRSNMFGNNPDQHSGGDEEAPLATTPDVIQPPRKTKVYSKKIPLSRFVSYVKESLNNGELQRQHELFPRGQTKPWECGAIKENKSKNRYTNLIAYDHTRVVLKKISGKPHSDYINANYVDGYEVKKAYIATQGPKISTVNDFWRMIWQEGVLHIAMLANIEEGGKKKVEMYWPDQHESLPFGDITVYYTSSQVFADYKHRKFRVVCNDETREIHQYHFSSWPDHGVPLYSQSLIPFLQTIQSIPLDSKSPIIVHCSAGVGRTGTIILCDICLRMAAKEDTLDILRTLQQLRDQRPNMVDNIQQYKLVHLVILEYLFGIQTGLSCQNLREDVDKLIKDGAIKTQMNYLMETAWQDQTMKSVVQNREHFVVVKEKNRVQSIVPEIQGSIFLSRYPVDDEPSTYINAVKVDGFQCTDRFIVTQQPMPNTLGDFWRLIHEKDISVIISLNEVNVSNKSSCLFWPSEQDNTLKPVDYITLRHANTRTLEFHDLVSIHLHINDNDEYRVVEIMAFKKWRAKTNCPKKVESFLSFYEESNVVARQSKPIVVTCFDGALASGLYVALTFIIEKINLEQVCDVCQAVRAIRHNRSQFVQNEEQFQFLYKAAVAYIDGFQSYANFN